MGKFIPNHSTLLQPLKRLLEAGMPWNFNSKYKKVLQEAKKQIASAKALTHYNPTLPINLAADASAYRVGAVISHLMSVGSERPIAFALPTLSSSERKYAQLEKEALSVVYGIKKFYL